MTWVSDLVWLDEPEHPYNSTTGIGAIGVEFAGTAISSPSPFGQNITIAAANNISQALVDANNELQWQDAYYRGYFELSVGYEAVNASFFGIPKMQMRNAGEIPLANFTVRSGENRLGRGLEGWGVGGGRAESGYLRGGEVVERNLTNDTSTGRWFVGGSLLDNA